MQKLVNVCLNHISYIRLVYTWIHVTVCDSILRIFCRLICVTSHIQILIYTYIESHRISYRKQVHC